MLSCCLLCQGLSLAVMNERWVADFSAQLAIYPGLQTLNLWIQFQIERIRAKDPSLLSRYNGALHRDTTNPIPATKAPT